MRVVSVETLRIGQTCDTHLRSYHANYAPWSGKVHSFILLLWKHEECVRMYINIL